MTKMRKLLLCAILFASLSLAEELCDWYGLAPASQRKIFYSKAYGNIPFLDDQKPGVYIVVHRTDLEVDAFVYLEHSGVMHVYMEPGIMRNEMTEGFYPCIDKHVKANLNYFKSTCVHENLNVGKGIYDKIMAFLMDNPQNMRSFCNSRKNYEIKIFLKEDNGITRNVSFYNPRSLEKDLQEDVFIESYSTIYSQIETLLDDASIGKCNWRNLVKNPALFASNIYRIKDYLLYLSRLNCPTL